MTPYLDVISTIKEDLLLLEKQRKEYTEISELKQTETLLKTLETKLSDFQQASPRLNPRTGLINLGGSASKILFGTATSADVRSLHETLNALQVSHSDVVQSLSGHLTYIKKLNTLTQENADAIMNLSSIVKDEVIQSHDRFQQFMKNIVWLNATL
jgi:flagellar capping protein FliD